MTTLLIAIGAALIMAGIVGSFLPGIPGTPLGYLGLLSLQLMPESPFSISFLVIWAIIVVIVMSLDQLLPAAGSGRMGGTRYGVIGCLIGAVAGLIFFPPLGLLIGPVVGAFIGELIGGQKADQAVRSAIGSFIGFFVSTVIKVAVSLIMAYYFITALI
ncbi:MAG: DUF456 domain-containing protein [Balneolaceae bacterium]|nr:DUF456 domain-containing protein [Balneolaceae bacterium]